MRVVEAEPKRYVQLPFAWSSIPDWDGIVAVADWPVTCRVHLRELLIAYRVGSQRSSSLLVNKQSKIVDCFPFCSQGHGVDAALWHSLPSRGDNSVAVNNKTNYTLGLIWSMLHPHAQDRIILCRPV